MAAYWRSWAVDRQRPLDTSANGASAVSSMQHNKRKRPSPHDPADIFKITYKDCTRELSRDELAKAPDSLLGRILLSADQDHCDDELVIPSEGDAPDHAVWHDGDKELFEVRHDVQQSLPQAFQVM